MTGANIIGYESSKKGAPFHGITATGESAPVYAATAADIDAAMQKADAAFQSYRHFSRQQKAAFLRNTGDEIEALGDELIQTAMAESGLPQDRITGERGRTCGQLRLFANYIEEGSWVEAVIDRADPARQPMPKPGIRKMLVPVGPVVVFTASNFPLAFSTAGGDTASALAAGCPVVVKGHEAHPATNELVSLAIQRAAQRTGMPDGVFSSLNGDYKVGQALVQHPLTASVAFTGSHRGGKALFDLANRRPRPIPVFAEMGSINPVVLLPGILENKNTAMAQQIAGSVTLGAGQFCTNPGLVLLPEDGHRDFAAELVKALQAMQPQCMLNRGIFENYHRSLKNMLGAKEVSLAYGPTAGEQQSLNILPSVAVTSAQAFLKNPLLQEEVFGPFTLLVTYSDKDELLKLSHALHGQLTASVFGEKHELPHHRTLLGELQKSVGRLILNTVPTGVEVCHAMHHGGPWPATTDGRFTSVGTAAIRRFVRPVAFQGFPEELLPPALQDGNPLGIWRMVDGKFVK